ncbi:MAG: HEPN domain-containing protein [Oscillospiraceae bacterium]
MLPEQAIEISKVRFDHAKECLRDAKLLLAGESYRSAANRAYYAIFHAMRAVLALDGVDMKHHSGIISEFRKRYIKTGVFDISLSGLSSELSDVREGSDYNDFFIVSKADTAEQVRVGRDVFDGGRNLSADKNIESVRHLTQTVTQTGQKRDGRNR